MSKYLDNETIQNAVQRLADSRANSTLLDYLIFRRALSLKQAGKADGAPEDALETGLGAAPFQEAIEELANTTQGNNTSWEGAPDGKGWDCVPAYKHDGVDNGENTDFVMSPTKNRDDLDFSDVEDE